MSKARRKYQKVDYAPANLLRHLKQESLRKRSSLIKISVGLIAVILVVQLCIGPFGTFELIRKYQKARMLRQKIHRLTGELASLQWQYRQLDNEFYLEKLAREQYWMKKPGEILIKLPHGIAGQNDPS